MFSKIAIIGVGLLGGSLGLAIRRKWSERRVVGIGRNAATLETAKQIGAIHEFSTSITDGVVGCGLIVVCTPVGKIAEHAISAAEGAKPQYAEQTVSPIITDVGSAKQEICKTLEKRFPLANNCRFLGGHPIAGSEKNGVAAASETLFENRVVALTPTGSTLAETTETLRQFWESLGANVVCMSAEEHDRILARTSHLPHAVSAALAKISDREIYGKFCGSGFQSVSRLAAGSPEIWLDIFLSNRKALLSSLNDFEQSCRQLRNALENNDASAVLQFLNDAGKNAKENET
ncbi:MAG: prephenate dehydrogenase [Planctomycetaceae bacterium]|jgi:prephenate dehydrogenase|nr:prephenate dehydrogenase [Planctomycetaceae bacterium]